MKSPAFQFYSGDWLRDAALRMCSSGARGLWIDMIAFMHQAEPYGHLIFNGRAVDLTQLAKMVGESAKDVAKWLGELEAAGVPSRDDNGTLYCRRMVRDHLKRVAWREQQQAHRDRVKDAESQVRSQPDVSAKSADTSGHNQPDLRSSVLQSSKQGGRASRLAPDWVLPDAWRQWALTDQGTWTDAHVRIVGENFRDYWLGAPKGSKVDWLATWRKWVRKEGPMPGQPKGAAHSETKAQKQIAEQRENAEKAAPMPEALRNTYARKAAPTTEDSAQGLTRA